MCAKSKNKSAKMRLKSRWVLIVNSWVLYTSLELEVMIIESKRWEDSNHWWTFGINYFCWLLLISNHEDKKFLTSHSSSGVYRHFTERHFPEYHLTERPLTEWYIWPSDTWPIGTFDRATLDRVYYFTEYNLTKYNVTAKAIIIEIWEQDLLRKSWKRNGKTTADAACFYF